MPSSIDLKKLAAFDACTISNAVEQLNVRLRNEGFMSGAVRCRFPQLPLMIGYAATGRIRTAAPPMTQRCYYDRMDWWQYVATLPKPCIMVLQDVDYTPGIGAFVGEIHAAIGAALGCAGCITNGAVRDLPAVEAMKFHLFSGRLAVSHSYAHIIEMGEPVEIGGLKVSSGDLIAGDRHGVLNIPLSVADQVASKAAEIRAREHELVSFCRSPQFTIQELERRLKDENPCADLPWPLK